MPRNAYGANLKMTGEKKKKSLWKKMQELANPDWSKRQTGRDKALSQKLKKATGA